MKVYVNFYESMKEAVEKAVTKAPDSSIEPTQEKPQKDQPARNSEFFKVFLLFLNYCKYLFKAASAKRSLLGIAFVVVVVVLSAIFQKMIDSHHRSYNTLLHHLEKTIQVS